MGTFMGKAGGEGRGGLIIFKSFRLGQLIMKNIVGRGNLIKLTNFMFCASVRGIQQVHGIFCGIIYF